ncbi:Gfo/Idh/MocA family protein [Photobacterium sp. DNB23_23_1]
MKMNYKPRYPIEAKQKIGIVGAGEIVKYCHLPAYRMANFEVTAISDLDHEKAKRLAEEFCIPNVCKTSAELAALDCVDIIDIATPAEVTPSIVELACIHSKHVLCQKPLALDVAQARLMDIMLKECNLKGAVNHQMRYSPSVNAARDLIQRGELGELSHLSIDVNVRQPWEEWTFWHNTPNYNMWGHTIHYFDTLRYLLDKTPTFIYTQATSGFERGIGEDHIKDYSFLDFGNRLKAQVDVNHDNRYPMEDWKAGFRVEGSKGVINATNGALHNYPHGKEDEIAFLNCEEKIWHKPKLEGRWFPHAFMGTMGELMLAIDKDTQANNSIEDGIDTIRMVEAAVKSINENRPVYLEEI